MLSTPPVAGKKSDPPLLATPSARLCHRCGHDIGAVERVGRRDTCPRCGSDLHCCLNCSFFAATSHNQCREPQAEPQVEKQAGNFCDYFSFRRGPRPAVDASAERTRAQLDALFKRKS